MLLYALLNAHPSLGSQCSISAEEMMSGRLSKQLLSQLIFSIKDSAISLFINEPFLLQSQNPAISYAAGRG
jgi:hypothetical protein